MQFREEGGGNSENLIRLKDKETITGVFRGDLVEFQQHWENKTPSPCSGDGCPKCAAGKKPSFRFRLNFIMKGADGKLFSKIFEQGWTVYGQLRELNKEYPLNAHFVKISRSGSGQNDTTYTILPTKNSQLTPDQERAAAAVPLIPLDPSAQGSSADQTNSANFGGSTDDIPF